MDQQDTQFLLSIPSDDVSLCPSEITCDYTEALAFAEADAARRYCRRQADTNVAQMSRVKVDKHVENPSQQKEIVLAGFLAVPKNGIARSKDPRGVRKVGNEIVFHPELTIKTGVIRPAMRNDRLLAEPDGKTWYTVSGVKSEKVQIKKNGSAKNQENRTCPTKTSKSPVKKIAAGKASRRKESNSFKPPAPLDYDDSCRSIDLLDCLSPTEAELYLGHNSVDETVQTASSTGSRTSPGSRMELAETDYHSSQKKNSTTDSHHLSGNMHFNASLALDQLEASIDIVPREDDGLATLEDTLIQLALRRSMHDFSQSHNFSNSAMSKDSYPSFGNESSDSLYSTVLAATADGPSQRQQVTDSKSLLDAFERELENENIDEDDVDLEKMVASMQSASWDGLSFESSGYFSSKSPGLGSSTTIGISHHTVGNSERSTAPPAVSEEIPQDIVGPLVTGSADVGRNNQRGRGARLMRMNSKGSDSEKNLLSILSKKDGTCWKKDEKTGNWITVENVTTAAARNPPSENNHSNENSHTTLTVSCSFRGSNHHVEQDDDEDAALLEQVKNASVKEVMDTSIDELLFSVSRVASCRFDA
jgi:hypothetical protein